MSHSPSPTLLKVSSTTAKRCGIILAFLGLFAFQAIHLDGDPSPMKGAIDIDDEGFWQHSAREKVLLGTFLPDEFNQALIGSPLFTAVQYGVFSVLGVRLQTARILPLVSLWLILLMLYQLMRARFSTGKALLAVAVLGLSHEMLMYAKWSTPIPVEMCFLTAVLYFWELAKKGRAGWLLLSAGCLTAAVATKLSAVLFFLPMLLFLAGEYLVRKNLSRGRILLFVGAATAFGLVLLTLTLLNYDQISLFMRTIGTADSTGPRGFRRLIYGPINTLRNDFLRQPSVVILLIFAFLWLLDFVAAMVKHGIRATIQSMSTIELYSLCWLAGALTHLSLVSYRPDRRYVMFLVPLTILTMEYVFRTWERVPKSGPITARGSLATSLAIRIALCLLAIYAWSYYVCHSIACIESRWLGMSGVTFSTGSYAAAMTCCAILAALLFVFRKPRIVTAALLSIFFGLSLTLDAIWYSTQTYTLRDTSRWLAHYGDERTCVVGNLGHLLTLENSLHPVWSIWGGGNAACMNEWIHDFGDREGLLMVVLEKVDGKQRSTLSTDIRPFPPNRMKRIGEFKLCPIAFTQTYRFQGTLWWIYPSKSR